MDIQFAIDKIVNEKIIIPITHTKTKFGDISNSSNIAQGHNSTAAIYGTSKEEAEILKIYRDFDFDKRLEFLNMLSKLKK